MKRTTRYSKLLSLLALLLALSMTFLACGTAGGGSTSETTAETVPETVPETEKSELEKLVDNFFESKPTHAEIDFNTLEYHRPDVEAFEAKAEELKTKLDDPNRDDIETVQTFLDFYDMFLAARSASTLMNLIHDRDVTNEENAAELEWVDKTVADFGTTYSDVLSWIAHSDYCKLLLGDLTEEEIEEIDRQAEAMDEEYVEMQAKITALNNRYDDAYAKADDETLDEFFAEAGEIYLELIDVYKREAEKFGEESVADFWYRTSYERSYTPEEGLAFDQLVKKNASLWSIEIQSSFTAYEIRLINSALGGEGMLEKAQDAILSYFTDMEDHLQMKTIYDYMQRNHLCDISADECRTQSIYTTFLSAEGLPYLFLTESGSLNDVDTFFHEFGHYTSFYQNGDLFEMDVCEIQSQANEFLALPYYTEFLSGATISAYEKYKWYISLDTIAQGCLLDEFQQIVFSAEETWTVDELNKTFLKLAHSYGMSDGDYIYPLDKLWMFIPHTFQAPFYYISYAISLFPTLQIAALAKTDRDAAIDVYEKIMCPDVADDAEEMPAFEELIVAAGLVSPFAQDGMDAVANGVHIISGNAKTEE